MNVTNNVRSFGAKGDGVTNDQAAIQAAINALPTLGGAVVFPPGTYLISSTLTMPDKPVTICGSGFATIIDLGANAISAFTIPNGLTVERRYDIKSIYVKGGNVAGQEAVRYNDANNLGNVYLEGCQITDIETIANWTAYTYSRQSIFHATSCNIFQSSNADPVLAKTPNPANTYGGAVAMQLYSCAMGDVISRSWTADFDGDLIANSCTGRGVSFAMRAGSFNANGFGCTRTPVSLRKDAPAADVNFYGNGWDLYDFIDSSYVFPSNLSGAFADISHRINISTGSLWTVTSSTIAYAALKGPGGSRRLFVSDSWFISAPTPTRPMLEFAGEGSNAIGCRFNGSGDAIKLTNVSLVSIADCDFVVTGSGKTIDETGTSNDNRINGNTGLSSGAGPTIIGAGSRIDGAQAGNSAFVAEAAFKLAAIFAAVGNVGTGEDDLQTFTVPANVLAKDGAVIEIENSGTVANNANAKTVKLYVGGTAILTVTAPISVAVSWAIRARIIRTGVDTQKYSAEFITTGAAGVSFTTTSSGTLTKDDGAAIIVKTTGEATDTDDIISEILIGKGMN
jgi:hypothetical protein